jgi:hypothetical protein
VQKVMDKDDCQTEKPCACIAKHHDTARGVADILKGLGRSPFNAWRCTDYSHHVVLQRGRCRMLCVDKKLCTSSAVHCPNHTVIPIFSIASLRMAMHRCRQSLSFSNLHQKYVQGHGTSRQPALGAHPGPVAALQKESFNTHSSGSTLLCSSSMSSSTMRSNCTLYSRRSQLQSAITA